LQGLGFRPFVFRLANQLGIKGGVANTPGGVVIYAQGKKLKQFLHSLLTNPPPYASIVDQHISYTQRIPFKDFSIQKSRLNEYNRAVFVLPDLSICPECRAELFSSSNRRFHYPFINCTQCGPRYTIILTLPYDRPRTTMRQFVMCAECKIEYTEPTNRRFHAEPIACPKCGPRIRLLNKKGQSITGNIIKKACCALQRGNILAIKGLGGFHLACDATNDRAVQRLRSLKERGAKPFALMAQDFDTIKLICETPKGAFEILSAHQAPILLLPKKIKPLLHLSPAIAPNNGYLGVMLPYTPLHLLVFDTLKRLMKRPVVLVMTSANPSDEPIAIEDRELLQRSPTMRGTSPSVIARHAVPKQSTSDNARTTCKEIPSPDKPARNDIKRKTIFDLMLTHNRPIANRCDDSVVALDGKKTVLVRRARGYAPQPIGLGPMFHVKHPTLAMGGDGRNVFGLAVRDRVHLSPHIGSLESASAEQTFLQTLERMMMWTGIVPKRVVCDLHPDYTSVRLAEQLASKFHARLVRVQHHFAHLLGVMAEHSLQGPVIGIAADGTGYGVDGTIWGCELILINKDLTWERVGHLGYLRHNAGAGMIADPEKLATQYLTACGIGREGLRRLKLNPDLVPKELPVVTSSLGRLFDAVATITGICQQATFEGEPAIALESAARKATGSLGISSKNPEFLRCYNRQLIIEPIPILKTVADLTVKGEKPAAIALWFHKVMINALASAALNLCKQHNTKQVLLAGGSFQNHLLRTGIAHSLSKSGLVVYYNQKVPLNDGGLALGQAVVS